VRALYRNGGGFGGVAGFYLCLHAVTLSGGVLAACHIDHSWRAKLQAEFEAAQQIDSNRRR
jgi:hypothetical protein